MILNTINFYPSSVGEKNGFVRVGIKIKVMDAKLQ